MHFTRRLAFTSILLSICAVDVSAQTWSHPSLEIESRYADAVLAFNSEKYAEALSLVEEVLRLKPDHLQALELKALVTKTRAGDAQALPIYYRLIELNPSEKDRAPYDFEIGLIHYRAKRGKEARHHLSAALRHGFNERPARFFLGSLAFTEKRHSEAETLFQQVTGEPDEMGAIAHYYLGVLQYQSGLAIDGTRELVSARRVLGRLPPSPMTRNLGASIDQALSSYESGRWFGSFAAITQYDGNVSLLSITSAAADSSGMSTAKMVLSGGFGFVSSPLSPVQWTASYRLSFNKNLSSDTQGLEFVTNAPSLTVTFGPLNRTHFGLKFEGNNSFRNADPSQGRSFFFREYALSADVGPFLRWAATPRLDAHVELIARPQKYFQDADRDALAFEPKASLQYQGRHPWLNPSLGLSFESNAASGASYKSRTIAFEAGNELRLGKSGAVTLSGSYAIANYFEADRSDRAIELRLGWVQELQAPWALVMEAGFTRNSSTQPDIYSYTRPVMSLGLSYTL